MIAFKNFIQLVIICTAISFGSCNTESKPKPKSQNQVQNKEKFAPEKKYTYSEDIKSEYQYKVSGFDYDHNKVYGQIDLEGQTGIGTLIRNEDTQIEIIVEDVKHDNLVAIDMDGNQYNLKFD